MPSEVFGNWFTLDEKSGIVRTRFDGSAAANTHKIDFEKHREILLSINVIKSFDVLETVTLKINIRDLNDNEPIFDEKYNYRVSVKEDDKLTVGQERFITRFSAFDFDGTKENSKLSYQILAVDPPVLFKTSDFKIKQLSDSHEFGLYKMTGVDMDRDNIELNSGFIRVDIEVSDNVQPEALTAQKQIIIELVDVNDNPPVVLNKDRFTVDIVIFENEKLGVPITQIKVA